MMCATERTSQLLRPIVFMDDYCKDQNVFLSNDDRINHTVDRSKS